MTLEQAKLFLLTPPPAPPSAPRAGIDPRLLLVAAGALAAGVFFLRPGKARRLGRTSRRFVRSPLVQRAVITFLSSLAAKKAAE